MQEKILPSIAILGATGAVGLECLKLLEERKYPYKKINLLASPRSAGKIIDYLDQKLIVEETNEASFNEVDVVFISADTEVSLKYAPIIASKGSLVIDDSSAFRMKDDVPLVIPEVNPEDISMHKGIIAIPNCTTTPLVMVVSAIEKIAKVKRLIVSTYQSVSGAGNLAIEELFVQSKNWLENKEITNKVFPHPIAFSLIPQIDSFESDGYTKEEHKMINETRKILHNSELKITSTCVRVPVPITHCESINLELSNQVDLNSVYDALDSMKGLEVLGKGNFQEYPMPYNSAGKDSVFVGRIRQDLSCENGITLWVVSDNLRKGAALNAIQIMETALSMGQV
jgi:aspartate-semialdehyde dehydrogenase